MSDKDLSLNDSTDLGDPPQGDDRLRLSEAAQRLGMTYHQTRDLIFRGRLKGWLIDGRWVVSRENVDAVKAAS